MSIPSKNLEKLRLLVDYMNDETLTKDDFEKAFKALMDFVMTVRDKNDETIKEMNRMHEEMMKEMKGGNTEAMGEVKKKMMDYCMVEMQKMYHEHEGMMDKMQKDHAKEMEDHMNEMKFIYDKVQNLKSGKDADEKKIVDIVLAKLPQQKDFSDIIKELEDKLKDLIEQMGRLKTRNIYGGAPRMRDLWVVETPSGTINGTNTAFYISTNAIQDSETIIADGVPMRKTRDYTLSGRTLTMITPPQLTLDAKFQKL